MVAVALALLVPTLLGRYRLDDPGHADAGTELFRDRLAALERQWQEGSLSEDDYREARRELERELLAEVDAMPAQATGRTAASPTMAVIVVACVPLLAFGLYLQLGTPQAFDVSSSAPAGRTADTRVARAAASGQIPHSLDEMVARLEARLAEHPDDADGWVMLGRSYAAFNRLEAARAAFRRADHLRPDHPLTLVAMAETLAGLQGNRLDGEPQALIRRALAIEPNFPRALWLAGVADYRRGERAAAAISWRRLLSLGGLNEDETRRVTQAIAAAETAPTATTSPAATGTGTGGASTATPQALRVDVAIAPELATLAAPGDTLYVFARAEDGPPMPLAVSRHTVAELPLTVSLDDSMAMTPQLRLSMFASVVVGARISRSGSATPSSGDLHGHSTPLSPSTGASVSVLIDGVVP